TQGLPRVDELFEARNPKGQAYLTETTGTVQVWEDGDKYVVQVTPETGKVERIKLEGQIVRVKSGTDVVAGDVLASNDDESLPIIAPFDGKVEATKKELVITSGSNAPARYEVPGFKQLLVAEGDSVEAGDRLTSGSINLQDLMRLKGVEATQRYIVNQILRIYA
ncbi:TPA: hypothetical protein DCF80_00085, partial [Candidatus Saccharibacteria bacterium]|nr:hypothetical protein [Candidatus Saccharibacteria bacterium]